MNHSNDRNVAIKLLKRLLLLKRKFEGIAHRKIFVSTYCVFSRFIKTAESEEGVPVQVLARQTSIRRGQRRQVRLRLGRPPTVGISDLDFDRRQRRGQPSGSSGPLP